MTKSADGSLSLWLLSESLPSLSHPEVILKSSWSHLEVILKSSWSHPDGILKSSWSHPDVILKLSWRIWGKKMKIVCSRQTQLGRTNERTQISLSWAPVGAKKGAYIWVGWHLSYFHVPALWPDVVTWTDHSALTRGQSSKRPTDNFTQHCS